MTFTFWIFFSSVWALSAYGLGMQGQAGHGKEKEMMRAAGTQPWEGSGFLNGTLCLLSRGKNTFFAVRPITKSLPLLFGEAVEGERGLPPLNSEMGRVGEGGGEAGRLFGAWQAVGAQKHLPRVTTIKCHV